MAKSRFAFSVRNKDKLKGFAWVWLERIAPKQSRDSVAVRARLSRLT